MRKSQQPGEKAGGRHWTQVGLHVQKWNHLQWENRVAGQAIYHKQETNNMLFYKPSQCLWSTCALGPCLGPGGSEEAALNAAQDVGLHLPAPNPFIPEDLEQKAQGISVEWADVHMFFLLGDGFSRLCQGKSQMPIWWQRRLHSHMVDILSTKHPTSLQAVFFLFLQQGLLRLEPLGEALAEKNLPLPRRLVGGAVTRYLFHRQDDQPLGQNPGVKKRCWLRSKMASSL